MSFVEVISRSILIRLNVGCQASGTGFQFFVSIDKWTSPIVFSAEYKSPRGTIYVGPQVWLKIEDDGTNLKFYIGDGWNWITLHSVSRTEFMSGAPDQVGWYADNNSNQNNEFLVRCVHWSKG